MKIWDGEKKKDHGHSQQIKLNNFNVSLSDKRKYFVYPVSEGDSSPSHNRIESVLSTTFSQLLKQAVVIELYWKIFKTCYRKL